MAAALRFAPTGAQRAGLNGLEGDMFLWIMEIGYTMTGMDGKGKEARLDQTIFMDDRRNRMRGNDKNGY